MNKLSNEQVIQESRYEYPYHYIPSWDGLRFTQTWTLAWGYEYLSYLYYTLDRVGQIGFKSLLDIGCGDGRFLFELGKRFPSRELAGIDFSRRAIEYAKIMDDQIDWYCADIKEEKTFGKKFDVISLIETLEHIKPDELSPFLKGAHHHLRDTGKLIVTVPSNNVDVIKKHYQHFDLNSLERALDPFFDILEVSYLNRKSSIYLKIFNKLLENKLFILNHRILLKWIYTYYSDHLLIANKNNCRRIFLVCKKKQFP